MTQPAAILILALVVALTGLAHVLVLIGIWRDVRTLLEGHVETVTFNLEPASGGPTSQNMAERSFG